MKISFPAPADPDSDSRNMEQLRKKSSGSARPRRNMVRTSLDNDSVCIIGAGIAGLTAALYLVRRGIPATVLEKDPVPGGLARSVSLGKDSVDAFYHFICRPDKELIQFIGELGLGNKLHWCRSQTAYYQNGRLYRFTTPLDLLRFTPVPFWQRIRFGWNVLQCRYRKDWRELDGISARRWLIQKTGQQAYECIWEPLLKIKFGGHHKEVSAAWMWHRINRVARSRRRVWEKEQLGFIEGGTDALIKRLVAEIEQLGGHILLNSRVEGIVSESGSIRGVRIAGQPDSIPCRSIYSTIPPPFLVDWIFGGVSPEKSEEIEAMKATPYIGVVCVLLRLAHAVTDSFWTNISIPALRVNGLISYTQLNSHFDDGRSHLVYVPFYVSHEDSRFFDDKETILRDCITALSAVQPAFKPDWIVDHVVSKATYAQAICGTGYASRIPSQRGPLTGLYLSDSSQLYPEDRSLSGAVRLGWQVAAKIEEDCTAGRRHA